MHDAHVRPPDSLRALFKLWRKRPRASIDGDHEIVDPLKPVDGILLPLPRPAGPDKDGLELLEREFCGSALVGNMPELLSVESSRTAFEVDALPGLYVFPSLFTPRLQIALLEKLLHRDLTNPVHKTNLHLHYDIPYPGSDIASNGQREQSACSFFDADGHTVLPPKDATVHTPITYIQMLESKLRWMTLGGQYDWTHKIYPDGTPPEFPPDVAALLGAYFPSVEAEAAIVNFYSPGDTLSVHRDVSEECDVGLISISIGCDGIFIVGNEDGSRVATIRLRSGDAMLMSGESRYAWHAVPQIIPNTCPTWLRDWPNIPGGNQYQSWDGWMSKKRINLNVRQMKQ